MKKYAKVINEETKACVVGDGTDIGYYQKVGLILIDVEQGFDGDWYLKGCTPQPPELTYIEQRQTEYPPIQEQLDMLYWDKINGTENWQTMITEIKTKYPKE